MKKKVIMCFILLIIFLIGTSCSENKKQNIVTKTTPSTPGPSASVTYPSKSTPVPTTEPTEGNTKETSEPDESSSKEITLGFAGDINFSDQSSVMQKLKSSKNRLKDSLSEDLIDEMNKSDIMMLNNEFPYSNRGSALAGKEYTFRSNPENVQLLKGMGVDVVSLANNHALDYGTDALQDTFQTLDNAGISYAGAGMNLDRAKQVMIKEIQGKKIGFMAASRVLYQSDWATWGNHIGILSAYDKNALSKIIQENKKSCDYLVVFLHWGLEYKNYPESYERDCAKAYIDAGADCIVGCHPHVIQGFEWYQGKPIVYSMGNFLFNNATKDSMMVKVSIDKDNSSKLQAVPCYNQNGNTFIIKNVKERSRYFNNLEKLSGGLLINENGEVEKK